jgi:phage shock protein C
MLGRLTSKGLHKDMKKDLTNKMIFGVCAGLANEFHLDASIVRLLFILAGLLTAIVPVMIIYLILAVVMSN